MNITFTDLAGLLKATQFSHSFRPYKIILTYKHSVDLHHY